MTHAHTWQPAPEEGPHVWRCRECAATREIAPPPEGRRPLRLERRPFVDQRLVKD